MIFVFGSNLAGRHGKGAALHAVRNCGAIYGQGEGRQGNSYAIPTKDHSLTVRPLYQIHLSVNRFKEYAASHPSEDFLLTAIGCGLAGYSPDMIAPMFVSSPSNVVLPDEFRKVLGL